MTASMPKSLAAPILVVEDSDQDFDTLRVAAVAVGVTRPIYRVASGGDCLAMLRGEGDVLPSLLPAFVLMGLNSHGVDGRQTLVAIKADDGLNEIPMVVLTTSTNPKDVAFCYQTGANPYHVKPLRYDQYLLPLGSSLNYWLESATLRTAIVKVD